MENTWINEYGDRIMYENVGYGMGSYDSFVATNKKENKTCYFKTLKSAKVFLNKFRKAKKWTGSWE